MPDFTLWSPFEPDLDDYTFVSDTYNGQRVLWPAEKVLSAVELEEFARQKAHLPDRLEEVKNPPNYQAAGFCKHEASRLLWLASVIWQKGGPRQFDREVKPVQGLLKPQGTCFTRGHAVYRPLKTCGRCQQHFCPEHATFLLGEWYCKRCANDFVIKGLGG